MKVKAINKPFRRYAVGEEFEVSATQAKLLVSIKRAVVVTESGLGYQTRMMQAAPVAAEVVDPAPWGYKQDGTPRARPGRVAKASE